jgi:RNA-binding protein YlmH
MDSELLIARIRDAIRLCDTSGMPKFVGFLTAEEAAIAEKTAKNELGRYELFGGYDAAERVVFGAFPDWCEDKAAFSPITSVTFSYRAQDRLSHRDILGALMSLGIRRETVGDILIEEGRAVAFLQRDILPAVLDGIIKIGRVGVTATEGFNEPLPEMGKMLDITDTVASLRLDCVVSALLSCSRGDATELILDGAVSVNSVLVEKCVKTVSAGDKITVRRKGKFIIDSVSERTRKDRIVLKAKKYI